MSIEWPQDGKVVELALIYFHGTDELFLLRIWTSGVLAMLRIDRIAFLIWAVFSSYWSRLSSSTSLFNYSSWNLSSSKAGHPIRREVTASCTYCRLKSIAMINFDKSLWWSMRESEDDHALSNLPLTLWHHIFTLQSQHWRSRKMHIQWKVGLPEVFFLLPIEIPSERNHQCYLHFSKPSIDLCHNLERSPAKTIHFTL